jgi:ADP-ribose pyrophosphatase
MRSDNPYKTLSTRIAYKNPWITVEENAIIHPDGREGIYGIVKSNDSVTVLPVNEKGEILLIRAFSYPGNKWHWELPGGGSNGGDDFVKASKRELLEETGISAEKWQQIGLTRPLDGIATERMAVLIAENLTINDIPPADDNGVIDERKFFDLTTIHNMVKNGMIDEGQTLSALYYYELWRKKNNE